MAESPSYRNIRRKLLSENPYFQQDLAEVRRKLGIPALGFNAAVQELGKDIPTHATGLPLGKPDMPKLKSDARRLGLPLEDLLADWRDWHRQRGRDFAHVLEETGWGALPIWGDTLVKWWVDRERKAAGLEPPKEHGLFELNQMIPHLPPGVSTVLRDTLNPPLDTRLPSVRAAIWLVKRYRLGEDYVPTMAGRVLGVPPGGGETDVTI